MTPKLKIYCVNLNETIEVDRGISLLELSQKLVDRLGFEPICARVNNQNEPLSFELFKPRMVEFIPVTHPSGERTYIRSLCMVLYLAVRRVVPQAKLSIDHSISRGNYCRLIGEGVVCDKVLVDKISAEMKSIIDRNLPFERFEDLTENVLPIFEKQGLEAKVKLLKTNHQLYSVYYRLDGVCDSFYSALAPNTSYLKTWELRSYKDGMLLVGFDRNDISKTPEPIEQDKMFKAFTDYTRFNEILGISSAGDLNIAIQNNHANDLVNVSEALHEKSLTRISDEITRRYNEGGARIVLISGPSSSGKTTTTKRLATQLMTNLLRPQLISLDDYFIDRVNTPRDESGEYDYESLYALDLEQFNADLNDILAGKCVKMPTYNFERGCREYRGNTVQMQEGSILLIEGIHGLNPELTAHIDDQMKFRLYVSALTTINIDDHNWVPTTDNRLLRRIIRDAKYRGVSAVETIRRWPSVRRGEERWIFPYQENADAMFNSSLLYELSVVKHFAEPVLDRVPRDVPEYSEALRLRRFVDYFESIDLAQVPSTSLLREFLGGSSFTY